jgi:hypothetical protein
MLVGDVGADDQRARAGRSEFFRDLPRSLLVEVEQRDTRVCAAKARAVTAPMPCAAPVIAMTRPESSG